MKTARTNLVRCPNCGWWGTEAELDQDGATGLFKGVRACPDCDFLEGHLKPYKPVNQNKIAILSGAALFVPGFAILDLTSMPLTGIAVVIVGVLGLIFGSCADTL